MADKTWRDRLQQAIADKGTSDRKLSLAIGRAPSYLYGVFKQGKEPTVDNIILMADELGVSLTWLLYGIDTSAESERLLRLYSRLTPVQKTDFLRLAESVAALTETPE